MWIQHKNCIQMSTNKPSIWFSSSWDSPGDLEKNVISTFVTEDVASKQKI